MGTVNPYARFETTPLDVDAQGYVRVDGVCIGRFVRRHSAQGTVVQHKDRNRRRRIARGREFVYYSVQELIDALEQH